MRKMSINRGEKILCDLHRVIEDRAERPAPDSYVSSLLQQGKAAIHEKLLEETGEVIEASREASREHIIHETADLWFHLLVLLGYWNISPDDIFAELSARWGHPGLTEKRERSQ